MEKNVENQSTVPKLSMLLMCSVLASIVGNAFIWVSAYESTNNNGMYAFFLIIISLCNLGAHSFNKPIMMDIAALLMTTVISNPVCQAYNWRVADQHTLLCGYVIALMGSIASFSVHFPTFDKEKFMSRLPLSSTSVLASVFVFVGCFVFWAESQACQTTNQVHASALWIATYNIITVLAANCDGRDIVLFQASYYLHWTQPFDTPCTNDTCKAGIALIWIGILMMVLICAFFAFSPSPRGELTSTPRGWGALSLLFVCAFGSILIWSGKDGTPESLPTGRACFTVVLMLLVVLLEVIGWAAMDPTAAYIAMIIMASVVSTAVSDIYANRDQQMRAGYIMGMTCSLMSIGLPMDMGVAKGALKEDGALNSVGVFVGFALIVSCMMSWANSAGGPVDVVSGYLGVLSTVSGAASYREGTLVCFYLSAIYLPGITPFTSPGNKDDYMLALLAVLALMYAYVGRPEQKEAQRSRQDERRGSQDTSSYEPIGNWSSHNVSVPPPGKDTFVVERAVSL